ncbi:TOG array regulator of axonemal microtubules protein 1-like [Perca flavescens]|uniref:TOG array regulator of axonemal microtubules protein 1-like n=1 Tax=Perca flavescens TaxID=8167 RepID=UPI00106E5270|nr:TOG array regulator of axonemal microtubules protein 1-like [Perca flavescens]
MAICDTLKAFLQRCKTNMNFKEDSDTLKSLEKESGSSSQSRILDIERAEKAELAALVQHAERLYASQKASSDAVLERMGLSIQQDTLPSPQPPAFPTMSPKCSLPWRRLKPIVEEDKRSLKSTASQTLLEEDPYFDKKLHLSCQIMTLASKIAKLRAANRSPSPDSTPSSVDTHTPTELRAISHIRSFTPTLPPTAIRRQSRIPVLKRGGAGKKAANRCKIQSAKNTFEEHGEPFEMFQLDHRPSPVMVSEQPAAPSRTLAVAPKVPAPPSKAAPPNRKGPCRGTKLHPKAVAAQEDLQPFAKPAESLSLSFTQLTSDDWEKKLDGLKSVRALARHHPALLKTKLHEICLVVAEEVNNLRSGVACAAMATVAKLHVHLGRAMDPEANWTGRILLLKLAQTTNAFVQEQANLALDALVEGCSPGRILDVLLDTGLWHRCAAVRGSTALHLHQLADIVGEDQILTAGKTFAQRFFSAVSKMAVDAAPEVRHYGQMMLQGLAHQKEFIVMWEKIVPVKDRSPLQKILKKMRQ